jgi:hypothetical protein
LTHLVELRLLLLLVLVLMLLVNGVQVDDAR